VAAAAILLMALPNVASAAGEDCTDPAGSGKLFKMAKRLAKEGRTPEALMKLQHAYKLCKAPGILVTIAKRYVELGQPEEASATLSRITNPNARLRRYVESVRKIVEAQLAKPISVSITADSPGASVSIDDGAFRPLPLQLMLARGTRRFRAKAPGREEVKLTRVLRGTLAMAVRVRMPELQGRWSVRVDSGSLKNVRVIFSGRAVTLSASERKADKTLARKVAPGNYTVNCLRGLKGVATATLIVKTNASSVAVCKFPGKKLSSKAKIVGWTTAGVSLVTLISGASVLASYSTDKELYPPPRYQIDSSKPAWGGVLLGTAAVAAIVSGLVFGHVITF